MTNKQRIIRFITYYKLSDKFVKGFLKEKICDACEYKGNTFTYKVNHKNFKLPEIEKIEEIIRKFKNGEIKMP